MNEVFDRDHVESVLRRVGTPIDVREAMLRGVHFPVNFKQLEVIGATVGITRGELISRMGGSP